MIGEREVAGFSALTLSSPNDAVEAAFVPSAGMVCCSLRHRGEELLGQRGGLRSYVHDRGTMGIPLLYPWANRVAARRFEVAGREVDLDSHPELVGTDPNGLPIHGLLSAHPGWSVERHEGRPDGAVLDAVFDFSADGRLLDAFPFPHQLRMQAALSAGTLRIATIVRASRDASVPVAFGYHPYLRIPGVPRSDWSIEIPVSESLELDESMLPTGARKPDVIEPGPLGNRTFDDEFVAPLAPAKLELAGGGRRLALELESGYPFTQVYAPADDDVIALEPMTAPTNALVSEVDLPVIPPAASYEAVFSITVSG
ncbi:MAG: aldose 1-epimerase [Actinobacteria bacterium]|nr:aldose 1-epimerase [Actinomycetota bacterium]